MKRLSLVAIIVSGLLFLSHDLQIKNYKSESVIYGDVISYYQILPAVFAEHDIKYSFLNKNVIPEKKYWTIVLPNGNRISKVTLGMAYMYLPFFVPAHYLQQLLGLPAYGYSMYYQLALLLSSIFYAILALVMIRILLLRWFSDSVVAITILLLALSTNLFYYATVEGLMSHSYSFFLITGMIYFTDKFYYKPKLLSLTIVGILLGLITLIRPTNALVLVFPALWGIKDFKGLQERFIFWKGSWKLLAGGLVGVVVIWLPQIIYWKLITGSFYYNGYGDHEVNFFFNNPQILNSFFSYRKGWLLYTPVMSFAILGFVFLRKYYKESFLAVLVYFVLSVYVISSWWLWWYGGGYGLRAYVDIYGALAFPMAAFVSFVFQKRHFLIKSLVLLLFFVLIFHNLFQVRQVELGSIHYSDMTKEAYWESFGRLYPTVRLNALLITPDRKSAAKGLYPKPVVKVQSTEDWIRFYMYQLSTDSTIIKQIQQKALDKGKSYEQALYDDAKWCYENDLERQKKTNRFIFF